MNDRTINDELYTIVHHGDLSNELDARLKSLPDVDKVIESLYQRDNQRINLLMLAALNGHEMVARILLSNSSDVRRYVEITGIACGVNGKRALSINALWCACDQGHYKFARMLIEIAGASVNKCPKNPLLIDAIANERLDTVQFLVENDYVDINETVEHQYRKYNSLMIAAAHGYVQIVTYLLEKGAKIDYVGGINNGTALSCAALHGHLDLVKLLCSEGANPNIKNIHGETPMILAFKSGHYAVAEYLLDLTQNDLCIDELEIIACSLVLVPRNNNNDNRLIFTKMIDFIRKSLTIREARNIPKVIMQPIIAYNFAKECQTLEELEIIQNDYERLFIEALLIRERILLPRKVKGLCEPLLTYGEKLVENGDFERCILLWEHVFHLYQSMNYETSLHRFVWVFCKMLATATPISPSLFLQICRLTFEPSEQQGKSHSVKNAVCLMTIAATILERQTVNEAECRSIIQWIRDICRQKPPTTCGQTLLHLSVNEQTNADINYRADEIRRTLTFPHLGTVQLLLTYGYRWIDLNATDSVNGSTALHIVSQSSKPDALRIAKLLLSAGAHIDCRNKYDKTPLYYAKTVQMKDLLQKRQIPPALKCLCASYIVEKQLKYELIWQKATKLNTFISLHGCISRQQPGQDTSKLKDPLFTLCLR